MIDNYRAIERLRKGAWRVISPTGRRGRFTGTYEKIVTGLPYILAYNIDNQAGAIRILHLIHGARDWPDGDWPK